jgi:flagellar hook-length control protein FliK
MTMMMNTVTQSANANAAAKGKDAAQPAQAAPEAPGAAKDLATPATEAQPFAAWLGEQARAAALAAHARVPADGDVQDAAQPEGDAQAASDAGTADSASALPQDGALLAAMAMPLMPLTQQQVAQAVQAAQPSAAQADAQSGDKEESPVAGLGSDGARRAAVPERGLGQLPASDAASGARPASAQADAASAPRFAVHAQADKGTANSGAQDSGADHAGNGNANGNGAAAAIAGAAASQPAANAPALDTVKLAGPPTAWRQSLQEALGERMHLQVGKGIEQAVIRLEPPQMGRIDIAIRHSAGALEVNISATNSEVLRQLQTVSENLRSDLSQRQFTEVAVTVAPAPKNNAAASNDPQQGRGRQQGREQEDQQPGHALAEANDNPSGFSLAGRA